MNKQSSAPFRLAARFLLLALFILGLAAPPLMARAFVNLTHFEIFPESDRIRIEWETAVELDNAGFLIFRGTDEGAWCNFNTESIEVIDADDGEVYTPPLVIPPKGDALIGAEYTYHDENAEELTWYYYFHQDIELDGTENCTGPIMVGIGLHTPTPTATNTPTATSTASPTEPEPTATMTTASNQATATSSGNNATSTATAQPGGNSTSTPTSSATPTESPEPDVSATLEDEDLFSETPTEISAVDATLTAIMAQVAINSTESPTEVSEPVSVGNVPTAVAQVGQVPENSGSSAAESDDATPLSGLLLRNILTFVLFGVSAVILSGAVVFYMRQRGS